MEYVTLGNNGRLWALSQSSCKLTNHSLYIKCMYILMTKTNKFGAFSLSFTFSYSMTFCSNQDRRNRNYNKSHFVGNLICIVLPSFHFSFLPKLFYLCYCFIYKTSKHIKCITYLKL